MREQIKLFFKSLGLVMTLLGATAAYPNKHKTGHGRITTMDQGENMEDLNLTKQIRSEIVGQGDLSQTAKNVAIVTKDKMVTLSGTVTTQDEKDRIEAISKKIAGADNVHNKLTVKNTHKKGR